MFEILEDGAKLALILALGYFAVRWAAAGRGKFDWRLLILVVLGALFVVLKVGADVLGLESTQIDRQILLWIHRHTTAGVAQFFHVVTMTGSWQFLAPLALVLLGIFAALGRKREAFLLVFSSLSAWVLAWGLKFAIGRERPALWETEAYWGASFPSAHTLNTTCLATVAVLCVRVIWPKAFRFVAPVAALWAVLVGLSRMVLGVHWPTDVVGAVCLGVIVPLVVRFSLDRLKLYAPPAPDA